MLQGQERLQLTEGPILQISSCYRTFVGLLLVDADVSRGADASRGQGLEDDRGVQAGKTGPSHIWLNVDATESQVGSLAHRLHGKHFLNVQMHSDKHRT